MNNSNHTLQQDENLREALWQDEAALPQMPADLNDRLMERLHQEKRKRHVAVWPWVAAACVAAVMVVWLLPPRENGNETMASSDELAAQTSSLATKPEPEKAKDLEIPTKAEESRMANPDTYDRRIAKTTERVTQAETQTPRLLTRPSATVAKATPKKQSETTQKAEVLLAQEKTADQPKEMAVSEETAPADLPHTQPTPQRVVLTERDIPISRPENYHYTPEEIALMRRQANEAYVKWMELEMEIMKYQYEQIAKQ